MMITHTKTVIFKLPEEYDEAVFFEENNQGFKKIVTSSFVFFEEESTDVFEEKRLSDVEIYE